LDELDRDELMMRDLDFEATEIDANCRSREKQLQSSANS
jgi:hypothetical protein